MPVGEWSSPPVSRAVGNCWPQSRPALMLSFTHPCTSCVHTWGYDRYSTKKTAVVCSSSPQHWSQGDETSGMRMFANAERQREIGGTEITVTREAKLPGDAIAPLRRPQQTCSSFEMQFYTHE